MIHVDWILIFFVGYIHTLWIFEFVDKTFCHNSLLIFWKLWKFDELTGHGYDGDDDNKDDDEDDNVYKY